MDATTPNSSRLMFHSFRIPEVAKLIAREKAKKQKKKK